MINRKAIYESQLNKAKIQFNLAEQERAWYDYILNRETEEDTADSILDKLEYGSAGLGALALGSAATGIGAPVGAVLSVGSTIGDLAAAAGRLGQAGYHYIKDNPEKAKESLASAGLNLAFAIPFIGDAGQAARLAKGASKAMGAAQDASKAAKATSPTMRAAHAANAATDAADAATDASKVAKTTKTGVDVGKEIVHVPKTATGVEVGKEIVHVPKTATRIGGELATTGGKLARTGGRLAKVTRALTRTGLGVGGGYLLAKAINNIIGPEESPYSPEDAEEISKKAVTDMKLGSLGVGQFDPGEASKSVSSVVSKRSSDDDDRFQYGRAFRINPEDILDYRRSNTALSRGLTENADLMLYKKIKNNVNSYLKSKEGEDLKNHLERISKEIDN
jgi:hypothetical protein